MMLVIQLVCAVLGPLSRMRSRHRGCLPPEVLLAQVTEFMGSGGMLSSCRNVCQYAHVTTETVAALFSRCHTLRKNTVWLQRPEPPRCAGVALRLSFNMLPAKRTGVLRFDWR